MIIQRQALGKREPRKLENWGGEFSKRREGEEGGAEDKPQCHSDGLANPQALSETLPVLNIQHLILILCYHLEFLYIIFDITARFPVQSPPRDFFL